MQVVIDIPKYFYEYCKAQTDAIEIELAVADGVPLQEAKWQKKKIGYESTDITTEWQMAQCSNCKRWHTTPYMYYFYEYKYCPFCGAKMEVTENADSN